MGTEIKPQCINCIWYKPNQAELAYKSGEGFCTSPAMEFSISKGVSVSLLDRSNPHSTHQNKTHHLENIKSFDGGKQQHKRYALVVQEDFGCVNFKV